MNLQRELSICQIASLNPTENRFWRDDRLRLKETPENITGYPIGT
jgi:hypothetical protein